MAVSVRVTVGVAVRVPEPLTMNDIALPGAQPDWFTICWTMFLRSGVS